MHRRWLGPVIEIVVSFAAAGLLAYACTSIRINPLLRVGQVSGLATIQIRFLLFAVPLLLGLVVAARVHGGTWFPMATRVVCAALAGLASGFVAGGIIVALRGTPFCLNAGAGDSDIIVMWANAIKDGTKGLYPPPFYPPLFPHLLSHYMQIVGLPADYALKDLQILGTLVAGPLAYLSWRLVLRPGWALAVGVIAAMIVIDPYKPYGCLVLVTFVPIVIRYLAHLRESADRHPFEVVRVGVIYGLAFGVLCLLYSGWFRWAAPGLVVAALVVFPWRRGWKHGVLLAGITLLAMVIVDWNYVTGVYHHSEAVAKATGGTSPMIVDDYFYFDTEVDPTYFAMWKGDMPGSTSPSDWPLPGELGGVGMFSVLLFAGLGIAIALGRHRTAIITIVSALAATWFQRFWVAHSMYNTKLVQLWPRTTLLLVYLFVVTAGLAALYVYERAAKRAAADSPLRGSGAPIGALVALTLLFGSMGSAISDRYMPHNSLPRTPGILSFMAHDAYKKLKAKPAPGEAPN